MSQRRVQVDEISKLLAVDKVTGWMLQHSAVNSTTSTATPTAPPSAATCLAAAERSSPRRGLQDDDHGGPTRSQPASDTAAATEEQLAPAVCKAAGGRLYGRRGRQSLSGVEPLRLVRFKLNMRGARSRSGVRAGHEEADRGEGPEGASAQGCAVGGASARSSNAVHFRAAGCGCGCGCSCCARFAPAAARLVRQGGICGWGRRAGR